MCIYFVVPGGNRKRPHPATSRPHAGSDKYPPAGSSAPSVNAAAGSDFRGQQLQGPASSSTSLSHQQPQHLSHPPQPHPLPGHPSDAYYHHPPAPHLPPRAPLIHDSSIDSQYGSSQSMDHPYGSHMDHPSHYEPHGGHYSNSPYKDSSRDHLGVHSVPQYKHKMHSPYGDLNRMSPIPEVNYNSGNTRTSSFNAPKRKTGPVLNLQHTGSYRDYHPKQASDTVV